MIFFFIISSFGLVLTSNAQSITKDELYLQKPKQLLANGSVAKALTTTDSLLSVYTGDKKAEASLHLFKADAFERIAEHDNQLKELLKAKELCKELNLAIFHAKVSHELGRYYFRIRQFQTSSELLQIALSIYKKEGDVRGIASITGNLGQLAFESDNLLTSKLLFKKSIQIADSIRYTEESVLERLRLGHSYWKLNKKDSMLQQISKAYRISLNQKDPDLQSNALTNLGLALLANQLYDSAERTLQKALKFAVTIQAKQRQLHTLQLLAQCSQELDNYHNAYLYLSMADTLSQTLHETNFAILNTTQKAMEENALLQTQNQFYRNQNYLITIIALLLVTGFVLIHYARKKNKRIEKIEGEKMNLFKDHEQILQVLPDIITGYDISGTITFINKNRGDYTTSSLIGRNIKEFLSPEEYQSRINTIAKVVHENREVNAYRTEDDRTYLTRTIPVQLNEIQASVITIYSDVTEQRAQAQIFEWVSKAAKIGGWEINIEKKTVKWSEEIYRIREVEKTEEPTWNEAFDYYTPNCRSVIVNAVDCGINKGESWDLELELITAKGNKKWVRDIGVPEMKNGKCIALRGVLQDITEKKNSELELKKREQELELAVQGADLGTWDWNIKTGAAAFNEHWASMLGYNLSEIAPRVSTWKKMVHPDDVARVTEDLQAHLNGNTNFYETEHRVQHKKGFWVWVLNKGKVVERDERGNPVRASGTYLDITERKRSEIERLILQKKLKEFRAAVDASSIVSITNQKGIIKYANTKFEEISQYALNELIGKNHNIINSRIHPKSFWTNMWKTIGHGNIWRSEVCNKRKDGTYYWVDTFIIPVKNTENKIIEYLSIRNDITEKKNNEIKLQEALKKAEESDRLKSSFLANISHEIRTPMNAIMGFSELLERPNLSDQKRKEFSKLIQSRSLDLMTIVNNILDVSRIEAGQISSVQVAGNLNELFDRLLLTFNSEALHLRNKEISIRSNNQLSPTQSLIIADFIRLYQVFNNLLTNASKFTLNGTLEFGCRLQSENVLLFWVRDTGIGIPPDQLQNIFQPFRQAAESIHQQFGGSGLGLAICKGFVELWGGKIWAESKSGEGSVFYFTMPYITWLTPDTNENISNSSEFKGKKILLVEDDIVSLRYTRELLISSGIEVIEASTGEDALKQLKLNGLDSVLLDLDLPDISGFEVIKKIKNISCLPVIAITAYNNTATKLKCKEAGFDFFLSKPVTKKGLLSSIKKVMK